MQIIICSLMFGLISFIIPKKSLKIYMYMSGILMSMLYLFFDPPESYDLYRHYEMMSLVEKSSISEILTTENYNLAVYLKQYPVYMILLYLISKLHMPKLMPFFTGVIAYSLLWKILYDVMKERGKAAKWKYCVGYCLGLFGYDYIAISGIRNILAMSIFTYAIYFDLVKGKNKVICFIAYIVCCMIHTYCVIFLCLRILLFFYNTITKLPLKISLLIGFPLIARFYDELSAMLSGTLIFSTALRLFYNYTHGSGGHLLRGNLYTCIVLYFSVFICALYMKYYINNFSKYKRYYNYYLLTFLFIISAYSQYDIFVRYFMFVIPVFVVFVLEIICQMHTESLRKVKGKWNLKTECYLTIGFFCVIFFGGYVLYQMLYKYLPATQCLNIKYFLR